jgi:superfamily II DNA/RNA helicase
MNGCHLLITTPPCFQRFTQTELWHLFNKDRIKHLIFDEIDSMTKLFLGEIMTIFKFCTRGYASPELNPQLIITASSWTKQIEKFMTLVCDPMFVIGAYIEAAVYTGCVFNLKKYTNDEKAMKLIEFLDDDLYVTQKTVVVVNDQNDINELQHHLLGHHIGYVVLTSKSTREDIEAVTKNWLAEKSGRMTVLVLTDDAIVASNVKCAQFLIHYSLPATWSLFSKRFVASFDYYQRYLSKKDCGISTSSDVPCVKIMLDEVNWLEIPHLVEFMLDRKLIAQVPPAIADLVSVRKKFL